MSAVDDKRPMRFKKLRIAWSVFWGLASILLIVLWVRSYWWNDIFFRTDSSGMVTTFGSNHGTVYFYHGLSLPDPARGWKFSSGEASAPQTLFEWRKSARELYVQLPIWIAMLFLAIIATPGWLPLRFSLRTLLIATTLLAGALGLIMWLQ